MHFPIASGQQNIFSDKLYTWSSESAKENAIRPELSTGRMDPLVGSGRVGLSRVTILPDFGGSGRVSTSDFVVYTDYSLVPKSI